jgi:hypothetical protein
VTTPPPLPIRAPDADELGAGFRRHPARLLVVIGLIGAVIGSVLPWIQGTDFMDRTFGYNGLTRTSDGWFLIFGGIGLALLVMNRAVTESRMGVLRAAPFLVAVFITAAIDWAYSDARTLVREAEIEGGTASIVAGFWVATGGAGLCVLGALWLTALDLRRRGGWATREEVARAFRPVNVLPALGLVGGAIIGMAGAVWVAARVLADATLAWMYFLMGVLGFVLGAGAGYRLGGWLGLVARGDSAEIRRRTD